MSLQFSPLSAAEHHLYLKVCYAAFSDAIMGVMYPNGFSEAAQAHNVASMARHDAQYPDRTRRFKVIDPSLPEDDPFSRVVGVSQWRIFREPRTAESKAAEKAWQDADDAKYGIPTGLNVPFIEEFHGLTSEYKAKNLGDRPFVYLHVLATRPEYQRKGVGALSMQWGTKLADELGLPAYLEASPQGVGLYSRWGFRTIDILPLDLRKWGHHESLTHEIMWRDPVKEDDGNIDQTDSKA